MAKKNLYIFTGKGGVGKTTCALAFCMHLQKSGRKCYYLTIDDDQSVLASELRLNYKNFELWSSVRVYLEKKFSSSMIAALIMKTPFFQALIKMVPGFRYVIYMGHLLNEIQKNPDTVYVLDSPSSGHLITLFDSLFTFQEIFGSGILAKDLQDSVKFWNGDKPQKINIISLPQNSVIQESEELQQTLKEKFNLESQIYLNSCFSEIAQIKERQLPPYMQAKLEAEEQTLAQNSLTISGSLPYDTNQEYRKLLKALASPSEMFF